MAPCALWAWACLWAVGRGGAGCHCHGHCQQPRATASTMATPSQQGATWGWWSGGTEPEIGSMDLLSTTIATMAPKGSLPASGDCVAPCRRLRGRSKAAAEQKAAARGLRRTEGGPEIEGAGARRAWGRQISPRRAAAAGPAADQHQQRARGCGSAVLPPLTGRLRPKPKCIASMIH